MSVQTGTDSSISEENLRSFFYDRIWSSRPPAKTSTRCNAGEKTVNALQGATSGVGLAGFGGATIAGATVGMVTGAGWVILAAGIIEAGIGAFKGVTQCS